MIGALWTPGMMSSVTDDWATPRSLFHFLDKEFRFEVDFCASPENTKCDEFIAVESDSLETDWAAWKTVWMNPPYGRTIDRWIHKAYETSTRGSTVVCLLPARTDTSWWHDICMRGEIRFLRGRLNFNDRRDHTARAPFPSAIVIFRAAVVGA